MVANILPADPKIRKILIHFAQTSFAFSGNQFSKKCEDATDGLPCKVCYTGTALYSLTDFFCEPCFLNNQPFKVYFRMENSIKKSVCLSLCFQENPKRVL